MHMVIDMHDDRTSLSAFLAHLGGRLRTARTAAGLSMQSAADGLGVSKAAVGHWETGRNPISADKLFLLSRRYGTTVAALTAGPFTRADLAAMVLTMDSAPAPTTAGGLPVSFVERRHTPAPPPMNVERRRGVTVYVHPQAHDPDAFPPRRPKPGTSSTPGKPRTPGKPSAKR